MVVAAFVVGVRINTPALPVYHRLNFRRGNISEARFAPDARHVIYSALLEGRKDEVFSTTVDSPESRPTGLHGFSLVSVSRSGELAIQTAPRNTNAAPLFRVPELGGAPRPILENAIWADWSPDGQSLAVATEVRSHQRVEYPAGKVLFETAGWISNLRFSPQGDKLAFMVHLANNSFAGSVDVVDLRGAHRVLSEGWLSEYGLAWSPKGDEVWFTASTFGHLYALLG
jgi:eukaryotic-like serine/threonine-protein kinase